MVLLNLKSILFFIALSQGVFSKAFKRDICGKDYGEATKDIEDISKQLFISYCDAANVYDYIEKGEKHFKKVLETKFDEKFSEKKCKQKCEEANKKLNDDFKRFDRNLIKIRSKALLGSDFYTSCENNCHLGSLNAQVLKKEGVAKNLAKRAMKKKVVKRDEKPCDPIDQGKITLTSTEPYNYGFYRYLQESDSAKTAISVINGCGPKNNAQISKIVGSLPYSDEFEPACNSHDICVTCHQLERSGCDSTFKNNMKSICSILYDAQPGDNFITKAKKAIKKADCNGNAELFGDTVSLLGENAYQDTPVNTSPECAACGVDLIKNTLYHTPFYVMK